MLLGRARNHQCRCNSKQAMLSFGSSLALVYATQSRGCSTLLLSCLRKTHVEAEAGRGWEAAECGERVNYKDGGSYPYENARPDAQQELAC